MNNTLVQHEFKGSGIKTPFEKMRARAIIAANLDAQGLSLIQFNLGTFLPRERHHDAFLILGLWAINPIRKQTGKFRTHPNEGIIALQKRVEILCMHLKERKDIPAGFLEMAQRKMENTIREEIAYLTQSVA